MFVLTACKATGKAYGVFEAGAGALSFKRAMYKQANA